MEKGMSSLFAPGKLKEALELHEVDVRSYSPLALAYIGDAVYELLIRTRVMNRGSMQVSKMHRKTASLVKAGAQAAMARLLTEEFTEDELAVYKRGRNAHSATSAKNATIGEYRTATGLEALVGYLYLTGQEERLLALVHSGLEKMGELEEPCDTKN